jgi:hypothetical protein
LQDPDQSTGEADFSSKRQAFTMLKHRCAALLIFTMLKHRCAALLIFTMLKLHSSALFISSHFQKHSSPSFPHHFSFPKQLRPALVSPFLLKQFFIFFSVAETPVSATFHQFFHDAETPLFNTFHFFPFPKHSIPSSISPSFFITETTPSSTCFAFSPFCC